MRSAADRLGPTFALELDRGSGEASDIAVLMVEAVAADEPDFAFASPGEQRLERMVRSISV